MTDQGSNDVERSSRTPKAGGFFRASLDNIPAWLSAAANVGIFLVGIVSLWTTIRVSGIEDYFRSEIAVRNDQVLAAERRLRDVQLRVESATNQNAALERERSRLTDEMSLSQRQLAFNLFERAISETGSIRDYNLFNVLTDEPQAYPAVDVNPGAEMLAQVQSRYREASGTYEALLARQLGPRCANRVQTPVHHDAVPSPLPRAERGPVAGRTPEEIRLEFERAQEEGNARLQSQYAYINALTERARIDGEAHSRAEQALLACGREILGLD